jgi:hypothetical protein
MNIHDQYIFKVIDSLNDNVVGGFNLYFFKIFYSNLTKNDNKQILLCENF